MEWLSVAALIVIGIILLVVELIFIPGTTVVGVLGLILMGIGVYQVFDVYGEQPGYLALGGTLVLMVLMIVYALRAGVWERYSNKRAIGSQVNEDVVMNLTVGDEGEAMSAIRPMGKGVFRESEWEVRSLGTYIEAGKPIRIVKIDNQKIYVEPLT